MVGVLFIVALVLHLVGGLIYAPATGSEDFLNRADQDGAVVTLGVLVEFVAVMSIPLIGIVLFPVLRRFSEALALAYVAVRSIEAVFLVLIESKVLALIDLSGRSQDASVSDRRDLQAIGDSLLAENDRIFSLYVLTFAAGALLLYLMLYRTALVPRWLSLAGVMSAVLMLAGTLLALFEVFSDGSDSASQVIFVLPVPVVELTLAFWLIVKGFNPMDPGYDRARSDGAGSDEFASIPVHIRSDAE